MQAACSSDSHSFLNLGRFAGSHFVSVKILISVVSLQLLNIFCLFWLALGVVPLIPPQLKVLKRSLDIKLSSDLPFTPVEEESLLLDLGSC